MRFAVAAASVLALGAAACGELDNVTTVKDLRVLAVKCEPAGFLVDLMTPGAATQAELTAQLTALVVDPKSGGESLTLSAVGCPDYIDTVTSATLQGTKLCPPESATSQFPEPIGSLLRTTTIIPADRPTPVPPVMMSLIAYQPTLSFGLRPDQIGAFFSPDTTGVVALDQTIALNREFGLAAIVNLNFDLNGQHTEAIKRVVYWPRLKPEDVPDPSVPQLPNQNPVLGDPADPMGQKLRLYSHRDETTGNPDQAITNLPATVSISAQDKLYVDPIYDYAAETYLLRVRNPDTGQVETRVERELIRFYFYATAGTFVDAISYSEPNPVTGSFHTDSEYEPPKPEEVPAGGITVTIWVVAQDERAGTDWTSTTITVIP